MTDVPSIGLTWGITRGVTRGDNARGAKSLRGARVRPNNMERTFFNTVHLLPKDLMFKNVGAKLVSCPGRHLTSVRPWEVTHLHNNTSRTSHMTARKIISIWRSNSLVYDIAKPHLGGFTQNPVTAFDPAYGQRQSSHRLHWPYTGEFSRFRPASGVLKIVLSKPDCRGRRWWWSCCMWEEWRW